MLHQQVTTQMGQQGAVKGDDRPEVASRLKIDLVSGRAPKYELPEKGDLLMKADLEGDLEVGIDCLWDVLNYIVQ